MNTVVSDGAKPIYEVETLGNPVSKVTTLRRVLEPKAGSSTSSTTGGAAENGVVAEVEWHWSRPSSVSFPSGDRKMPLNMFLHRGGAFNLSRMFVAPNGKKYIWKMKNDHLELVEKKSNALVAESHSLGLDVQEPATGFMDHVVLTFICMEKKRRAVLPV